MPACGLLASPSVSLFDFFAIAVFSLFAHCVERNALMALCKNKWGKKKYLKLDTIPLLIYLVPLVRQILAGRSPEEEQGFSIAAREKKK